MDRPLSILSLYFPLITK